MYSYTVQNRFFPLVAGIALALCLAAAPAQAKKHGGNDTADRGGLFQPPAPIAKPNLIIDMSTPKVSTRKGDAMRQTAPDAAATVTPAVATTEPVVHGTSAVPSEGIVPARAFEPTRSIESMRLHSLFE
ncbi:hypothetical protein [Telmatospirillum siberiense]|uniref:Uncharacterized protein n=1 Tax=Telmatospirillum siberiense TaxID=382514 RepID=A0A2N3Q1M3_9PROT|nr:hypothetical protein [Telmatospirillum siberiense]PKU26557.1 hypothetical protein CWS72_01575 [Telmatospirillum siberiense]